MNVPALIEQYRSLDDADLRYMLLKRELIIGSLESDLSTFLHTFVIPLLNQEPSLEVLDLFSREVLPRLFIQQIRNFNDLDGLFYQPLISNCVSSNNKRINTVQALRNVLNTICFNESIARVALNNEQLVYQFIHNINIMNQSESDIPMLLYIEVLTKLLKFTFHGVCIIIESGLLFHCLQLTQNLKNFDPIHEELLITCFQLASSLAVNEVAESINMYQLMAVSQIWYKFNRVPNIFAPFLGTLSGDIGNLRSFDTEDIERIINLLQVIVNFKEFYSTKSYSKSSTLINYNDIVTLINTLSIIYQTVTLVESELEQELLSDVTKNETGPIHADNDKKQEEYLQELDIEEDELAFEDDFNETSESRKYGKRKENEAKIPKFDSIKKLIEEIISFIPNNSIDIDSLSDQELRSRCHSAENEKSNFQDQEYENTFVYDAPRVVQILDGSSDLEELNRYVENFDHFIRIRMRNERFNESDYSLPIHSACNLIYDKMLQLLTRNKQFIKILKVGNMKQKIDESINLRLGIINILLTACNSTVKSYRLSYQVSCKILEQIVEILKNEPDESIQNQLINLSTNILEHDFLKIYGLDEDWYSVDICEGVELQANNSSGGNRKVYTELRAAIDPLHYI